MKKIILVICILSTFYGYADESKSLTVLDNAVNSICAGHDNKELCVKSIYKLISYTKTVDDHYMFCQNSKKSGVAVQQDACRDVEGAREFIDRMASEN